VPVRGFRRADQRRLPPVSPRWLRMTSCGWRRTIEWPASPPHFSACAGLSVSRVLRWGQPRLGCGSCRPSSISCSCPMCTPRPWTWTGLVTSASGASGLWPSIALWEQSTTLPPRCRPLSLTVVDFVDSLGSDRVPRAACGRHYSRPSWPAFSLEPWWRREAGNYPGFSAVSQAAPCCGDRCVFGVFGSRLSLHWQQSMLCRP